LAISFCRSNRRWFPVRRLRNALADGFGSRPSGHALVKFQCWQAHAGLLRSAGNHTVGVFTAKGDPTNCKYGTDFPCNLGAQYSEVRDPVAELLDPLLFGDVFNPYIYDGTIVTRRHTIDVEAAQASPLPTGTLGVPSFTLFRISRYTFGIPPSNVLADPTQIISAGAQPAIQQLQFNPPTCRCLCRARMLLWAITSRWQELPRWYSTQSQRHGSSTQTSRRARYSMPFGQITAMYDRLWTGIGQKYTPPFSASNPGGGTSKFDPTKTVPICVNGNTAGMRNQDIYTAQITEGLVVSSLQTAKPLLSTSGTNSWYPAGVHSTGEERNRSGAHVSDEHDGHACNHVSHCFIQAVQPGNECKPRAHPGVFQHRVPRVCEGHKRYYEQCERGCRRCGNAAPRFHTAARFSGTE